MLPELRDYIVATATSEMSDVLEDAHGSLERIGLEGYDEQFNILLNINDEVDASTTLSSIVELTKGFQLNVVAEHGIGVQPDILVEELTMLINALKDIQDYESPTDILDCIQDGVVPEEQLAQMLELVSPYFAERYLEMFETVSEFSIKRIAQYFNEAERNGVAMEAEPPTEVNDAAHRLRNFVAFLEGKELTTMELVTNGLRVGYPLSVYLKTYGEDIDAMEPKRAAEELVAICLISSDANDQPREAVKEIIDEFVSSLDKITRIDAAIKDISLRFFRYEQN